MNRRVLLHGDILLALGMCFTRQTLLLIFKTLAQICVLSYDIRDRNNFMRNFMISGTGKRQIKQ